MLKKYSKHLEDNFIVLVVLFSAAALIWENSFLWLTPHITKLLGLIMFGMGLTLRFSDFKDVWRSRRLVALGVVLQYLIMPLLAVAVSKALSLPVELLIGVVVVGACPGGTASNVVTYLARGNVALSVVLTLSSTLLAPLLTPAIIYLLLSQKVDVSFMSMVSSVFWIVAFPLFDGLVIRHFLQKRVERYIYVFPPLSMIFLALVIAAIVALNRELLLRFPFIALAAVVLHNGFGFILGYYASKIFRCSEKDSRTIAIEVGMQNSGLGSVLSLKFFSAASALTGALFSVWQNLTGIALAAFWSRGAKEASCVTDQKNSCDRRRPGDRARDSRRLPEGGGGCLRA